MLHRTYKYIIIVILKYAVQVDQYNDLEYALQSTDLVLGDAARRSELDILHRQHMQVGVQKRMV